MSISGFTKPLQLSDRQKVSLNYVKDEFRNRFVHCDPCLWSIELRGMPQIIIDVLEVIRFIVMEMGCYYPHLAEFREKIPALIDEGRNALLNSQPFGEAA